MKVLFCDNHILVACKEAGISTQNHDSHKISFEDIAKAWIKEKYQKPGNVFLQPIHRLDQAASGIVVFARTSKALSRLQEAMRSHAIKKDYLALALGLIEPKKARLVHHLTHGEFKALLDPQGKEAILEYEVKKYLGENTLLEIHLITGRYHQIRAQLAAIGHPIIADTKYGARKKPSLPGIALHHYRVSFTHPVTLEQLTFQTDMPAWA